MTAERSELPGFLTIPEPALMFAGGKLDKHPLRGLIDHGPFGLKYGTPSSLRLALLAPKANVRQLRGLISELTGGAKTKARRASRLGSRLPLQPATPARHAQPSEAS